MYPLAAMSKRRGRGDGNDALAAAMYYRGIETDAMAAAVSVDVQTVRRWLRGDSVPTGAHLMALLQELDAPADLLSEPPLSRSDALALMVAHDAVRRTRRLP